jgi:ubiquinone/menaquinone biosynthesis C-methylase UbiE
MDLPTNASENIDRQKRSFGQKTDYSKIAQYYDKVRTDPISLLPQIIKYGRIDSNSSVLDIGCGTGRFPINLSSLTRCSLFGLEPSREMLREAFLKSRYNVVWIQGDGQKLPFQNEMFDCVYLTFVLHHIENKDLTLQEIYRVLKKRAKCVILTTSRSEMKRHVLHNFPGVTSMDLKRLPSIPSVMKSTSRASFKAIHYHLFYRHESTSTEKYLERVRKKYISALTLLSEEEFQRGFKVFQKRIQRKYGDQIEWISGFVFVEASK